MRRRLEEKRDEALKKTRERLATKDDPISDVGEDGNPPEAKSSSDALHERADDLAEYRAISQTAASFMPQRFPIMCCGRPMVVLCGVLAAAPPP